MNPTLNEREKKIVASIINPDSMLLGPATVSSAVLKTLTERLESNLSEFEPEAISKVLYYIAQTTQPERAANVFSLIVNSKEVNPLVRQNAISSLGLLPAEFADAPLATALRDEKGIRESSVLKAVARAGDKECLKAVKSLAPTTDPRKLKLRAYAETMIALRIGEKISSDSVRRTLPRAVPFRFNKEGADTLKQTIDSIEGKPFGLELNEEVGFSYECDNCKHTMLFSASIKRGDVIRSISQPQIGGIIVMEDNARARSVLRYSILLYPDRDVTIVSVLRSNGDVALSGELRPDGDGLSLYLRDLGTEVRPVQVRGKISYDSIDLDVDVFGSVAKEKKTGIAIN